MMRYFEVSQHGKPLTAYADKYVGDITVAEINARLVEGVKVREISKKEFDSFIVRR